MAVDEPPIETLTVGLSIVIPTYNEQTGIGPVLADLHAIMGDSSWPYEIIVVDDGSTDQTVSYVDQTRNRLLCHTKNRGYGAALKTGVRHARYPVIATTDADGTYPNQDIPRLFQSFQYEDYDMIVGSRTGDSVSIPLARRPAKWLLTRLAEFVVNHHIPDLNSGLRVFQRDTCLQFFDLLPDGFSFTTTISLAMLSNGYLVKYVPIDYHPRVGRSKIRPIQDTLNFTTLILRMALYFAPLKIFLPLGGLILLLGILWGAFSKFALGRLADVSTMIIIMSAFQIAALGLLAELINKRLPSALRK